MTDQDELKNTMNTNDSQPDDDNEYDVYNWEFHKIPILAAAALTALFYLFVFLWVRV